MIHQAYELWVKELVHELDRAMQRLRAHRAQHRLKRIVTMLKVLVAQIDILEATSGESAPRCDPVGQRAGLSSYSFGGSAPSRWRTK